MGADQLDLGVGDPALGDTSGVGPDVAEVTNVSDGIGGATVGLAEGVEVRAGRGAAVGVVTELVDVHSALGVGIDVLDVVVDDGGGVLVLLRELDGAGDTGITAEDSDCATPESVSELFREQGVVDDPPGRCQKRGRASRVPTGRCTAGICFHAEIGAGFEEWGIKKGARLHYPLLIPQQGGPAETCKGIGRDTTTTSAFRRR